MVKATGSHSSLSRRRRRVCVCVCACVHDSPLCARAIWLWSGLPYSNRLDPSILNQVSLGWIGYHWLQWMMTRGLGCNHASPFLSIWNIDDKPKMMIGNAFSIFKFDYLESRQDLRTRLCLSSNSNFPNGFTRITEHLLMILINWFFWPLLLFNNNQRCQAIKYIYLKLFWH